MRTLKPFLLLTASFTVASGCTSTAINFLMKDTDHNGDGKISLSEACANPGSNMSKEDCAKEFKQTDLNGDGAVTKEELKESARRAN